MLVHYVPGTLTFTYQVEIVKKKTFSKFEKSLTSTWKEEKNERLNFANKTLKVEKRETHKSLDISEFQLRLILISLVSGKAGMTEK